MEFVHDVLAALWQLCVGSMTTLSRAFLNSLVLAGFGALGLATPVEVAALDLNKLPPATTQKADFTKDIEPIFADRCYSCHGPKKQESNFRLDDKAAALKGGDTGPAIVPGKSADSLLIYAVSGLHPDLKMPRKGDPLTTEQVSVLRAWIDQGAERPETVSAAKKVDHWAFRAPVRPRVPAARNQQWVRNPIDNFILQKLGGEKLKPSPEADKITLLRRVSLDLTGLPPRIDELDAYLADKSPEALEKQIERLLASPHYGERWGRHWLDAARYADSDGFEKDKSRVMWFYRDWVINAFNKDLPYDQFIIEQLAGDLLPNATQDQIVATGFLRNSMLNEEGGVDPEQFRMDAMFDRIDAVGKGMLGLTIQCAQCHNHKFDPITQEEYYRLFAFLNSDHEASRVVYTVPEQITISGLRSKMAEIEARLKEQAPDWQDRMAKWEESISTGQPEWTICKIEHIGDNAQRYTEFADHSMLAAGYAPTKMTAVWKTTNNLASIGAFRLELLTDPNLPCGGPGRSFKGTCALTEFKVEAQDAQNPTNKVSVKIAKASADYANEERALEANFDDKSDKKRVTGPVDFAIDGNNETAWGMDAGPGRRNQTRNAVFVPETPISFTNGTILTFRLVQNHGGWNSDDHMNNNLGRFRLSVSASTNAAADPIPRHVRDTLKIPREQRSAEQTAAVFSYWRSTVPEWKAANEKIEALWKKWPDGSSALTLMAREDSRETFMLKRGDWLKPSKKVDAGIPAFLHPIAKDAPPTRLTFAKWLADEKSPTTARVFVNRIWQSYFGQGLVSTPEDFGVQSEAPSHPELLDWLACEFMQPTIKLGDRPAEPWSIKHIHRLILNSATYRQSSRVNDYLYAKDPYNRLIARGPRHRVEGEIVRDIALATSGLLNTNIGGRSVMPPAPAFLFQPPASYAPFPWVDEKGEEKYRRAIYTFRRRSTPHPALQTFDVPNADFSCVRRLRSNSPLQALVGMNEPLFAECAQNLARKVVESGGKTDRERITFAYRTVLSRPPSKDEEQELLNLVEKQRARIADGWINAAEVATGKNEKPQLPEGITPTELAAYTVVSRVLLNLDETITKE
jgi:mono/diheme cytochrome c family protein